MRNLETEHLGTQKPNIGNKKVNIPKPCYLC